MSPRKQDLTLDDEAIQLDAIINGKKPCKAIKEKYKCRRGSLIRGGLLSVENFCVLK